MLNRILKGTGIASIFTGYLPSYFDSKRIFKIDATDAVISEFTIKGKIVIDCCELDFSDFKEALDDGITILLNHIVEGDFDNDVQK